MSAPSHPLQGSWIPIHAELDGQEAPGEVLEQTRVDFEAATYTVRFGGIAADQGAFEVEAEPGLCTLRGKAGPNAGRKIPCRFKVVEGVLTICYGLHGIRPPKFSTAGGSGLYLVSYRRA